MKNQVSYLWRQAEMQIVANKLARLERKDRDTRQAASHEKAETTGFRKKYRVPYPAVELADVREKISGKYTALEQTRIENSANRQIVVMDAQSRAARWIKRKGRELIANFRPRV